MTFLKHRRYHVESLNTKLNTKPEMSFPVTMESGHCWNEKIYIWKSELIFPSDKNNLFLFLHATQSNSYGGAFFQKKVNG